MTTYIHIEPDRPHRPAFAAWGLTQVPPLQTASASGWDVPVDLYPFVPVPLLEGAYVDGFLYGRPETPDPSPAWARAAVQAVEDPLATLRDLAGEDPPGTGGAYIATPAKAARRRTARARKDTA